MDEVRLLHERYNLVNMRKREIASKWGEFISNRMKKTMSDEHIVNVGCLLEMQYRIQNEEDDDFVNWSCAMARDIWSKSVLPKIISVQPIIGNHNLYYKYRNLNGEWLRADPEKPNTQFRIFHAIWSANAINLAASYHESFREAAAAIIADEIRIEQDRKVLRHLCENTAFEADLDLAISDVSWQGQLLSSLTVIGGKVKSKIGRQPNWIVTSPEIATAFEYEPVNSPSNSLDVRHVTSGEWEVYKDPLFPSHTILMGYKGEENVDAGFIYAVSDPLVLDEPKDDHSDRRHFGTFVDSRFAENGKDWYIKVNVGNMI